MKSPLLFLSIMLVSPTLYAQPAAAPLPYEPHMEWVKFTRFADGDAPYQSTRKNLTAKFRSGKSPLISLQAYLPKAKKSDIKAIFAAGLCVIENDNNSQKELRLERKKRSEQILDLIEALPTFPTNYECIRLRFLLDQSARGYYSRSHRMLPIAKMLLKRQPNDVEVAIQYGWMSIGGTGEGSVKAAQNYYERMAEQYPAKSLIFKSMMAWNYASTSSQQSDPNSLGKEITLRKEIIAAYRKRPLTPRNREYIANQQRQLQNAEKEKIARQANQSSR